MKKPNKPQVFNNTSHTQEQIEAMLYLGQTISEWRQREILLYQAPNPDNVVSVGTTFDGAMTVISEDPKSAWATALDYIAHGKVYTSK
jgi:hypothetical protein